MTFDPYIKRNYFIFGMKRCSTDDIVSLDPYNTRILERVKFYPPVE